MSERNEKGLFVKGHKGYKNSGNFVKGQTSPNKGKKLSPLSEEHRKKISETNKGRKNPRTPEWTRKIALAKTGKPAPWNSGVKSHFWRGGVSKKNRTERANIMVSVEYKIWRRAVFERDKYQCIWGGKVHGNKLQADHIKSFAYFPELRFAIDNGRTLCEDCHRKTDTFGSNKYIK